MTLWQLCNDYVTKTLYLCAMKTENDKKNIRILVVDDEPDLCEIIKFNLEMEGYELQTASSGEEALALLEEGNTYSLLLLDVMMPGESGFAIARQLKLDEKTRELPIIFLTARSTENDVITGLNLGADDYIAKPFRLRELLARVNAVLRRTEPTAGDDRMSIEGLVVDNTRKIILIDNEEVALTRTEFVLLSLLLSERGRVLSRQELIQRAWPQDVVVTERSVDVCITRLRKKIGRYASHITTKAGFGYSFE